MATDRRGEDSRASHSPARSRDGSIDEYRAKRDFSKTPEPAPEVDDPIPKSSFVVHRHEARNLHYDLRLEMDGWLKSWAIPRGFSYDPSAKKLATNTEDHPPTYFSFSGVIPKGEYGGGTMTIWDQGRWELLKADRGTDAVADGKLEFRLLGKKLRGEWHLVKTRRAEREWILFKARDRYARLETDKPPFFDLTGAIARDLTDLEPFEPMRPGTDRDPFSDPDWVFEVEFVGRRAALVKDGDNCRLIDASGDDLGGRVPQVLADAGKIRAENALLDGVLVVADAGGRPSKKALESRLAGESSDIVIFHAFDIAYYEEWDLRPLPLAERKEILSTLFPSLESIIYVDHVQGRGAELCEVTKAAGLPAVVAKRRDSTYQEGPSDAWASIHLAPTDSTDDEGESASPGLDLQEALRSHTRKPSGRKIPFTNLDKVLWPEDGYTKGDLIRYYDQIAEFLLPYLHERPMHMLRYPDGIHGKSFYQKDAPDHVPDWVETVRVPSDSKGEAIRYIVCNDRDTLVYLANLASIDLHPWFSKRTSQDQPDWAVFDLDPDGSPFPDVVRVARELGKVLRGIGLRPYLKTSGATGIHIFVPVIPVFTYDHTKLFCETIAHHVANDLKKIATVERVVNRRRGKVYIDFLQNRKGQTVVPAYAVRPRPGAPVSAPLDWDELVTDLDPLAFNIKTMPERVAQRGDLFQGTLHDRQDIRPAIQKFEEIYVKKK